MAARFGPVPGSSWEPPAVSQQGACEAGSPVTAVGVACSGVWGPRAALVGHVLLHVQGCVKAGAPVGCEVRPQLARNSGMEKRALSWRREAQTVVPALKRWGPGGGCLCGSPPPRLPPAFSPSLTSSFLPRPALLQCGGGLARPRVGSGLGPPRGSPGGWARSVPSSPSAGRRGKCGHALAGRARPPARQVEVKWVTAHHQSLTSAG